MHVDGLNKTAISLVMAPWADTGLHGGLITEGVAQDSMNSDAARIAREMTEPEGGKTVRALCADS
jgi:hypothetical protein